MGDVPRKHGLRLILDRAVNDPQFWKWPTVVLLIVFLFLLSGCASIPSDWKLALPASAKPWFYITVDDPDTTCRFLGSQASHTAKVNGCAIWKPQGCEMYLPARAPRWLIEHEERHCEGWTHP